MKRKEAIQEALSLIEKHGLITIRQIYYQLYPKFHNDYSNANSFYTALDKKLVRAREDAKEAGQNTKLVTHIIDTTRTTFGGDGEWTNPQEYFQDGIESLSEKYSFSYWNNQPIYPILWIEKDALSRVIYESVKDLHVLVCPSRGYSSFSYLHRILQIPKIEILFFSDHDPSGLDMHHDLKLRIKKYSDRTISINRIALTFNQVNKLNLPPNPTKRETRQVNYVKKYGNKSWELDALPPKFLRKLARNEIKKRINSKAWKKASKQAKKDKVWLTKKSNQILNQ